MGRPATKQRVKDARNAMYRELIVEAAERVFAEQGFEATRVQAVAKEAGISLATLYGVFPGKLDLYRAIQQLRTKALMERIGQSLDADLDPVEMILSGVRMYVTFHMEHTDYLRMHLREGHIWTTSGALLVDEQEDTWNTGFDLGSGAFQAGIDDGLLVDDDPRLMFRTMIAMHQVRLADWVDKGMEQSVAEVTQAISDQFIRSFCTPKAIAKKLVSS